MPGKKKLLWQLYPPYLLIIVFSVLVVAWYATRTVKQLYMKEIRGELEVRALLVAKLVDESVLEHEYAAVDSMCKKLGGRISTRVTVILPSGLVVGDSHEDPSVMDNHADRPEIRSALSGTRGRSERYSYTLGKDMMYVALPLTAGEETVAVVRTSMPVTAVARVLRSLYLEIGLAGLAAAFFAALLSLLVYRRLSRPLEEMKRGAERFAGGSLDYRLPEVGTEEIDALGASMNRMAVQLDERIRTITSQRNELEAVLSSMIEAVIVVDTDEKVRRANNAAEKLLGMEEEDMTGRSIQEVVRNVELHGIVKETLAGEGPVEEDVGLQAGGERRLRAAGSLIRGPDGKPAAALVVLHDVTDLKKLEDMRRDFVANVSHELKTPITSIKGFVETLKDGAIDDEKNVESFLDIISRHSDRLNAIVEDLLSLSRIEQEGELGQIALEKGRLKDVLDLAVQLHRKKAEEKNIRVEVSCSEAVTAKMNPALLEQAVSNLVDNAVKYSEHGGTVGVKALRKNGEVVVKVEDAGCGIPGEHLPRIFERFYRVDKARSRRMGGTGLGLAIVKHIVQAHSGRVEVESEPGKGSTFSIILPSA